MKTFIKMAMKLGEKLSSITNKLPRIHIFQTVNLFFILGNERSIGFFNRKDLLWGNFWNH